MTVKVKTKSLSDEGTLKLDARTNALLHALARAIDENRLIISGVTDKHGEKVMLLQSLEKEDSVRMLTIPLAVIHNDEYLMACKSSGEFIQREQAEELSKVMDDNPDARMH